MMTLSAMVARPTGRNWVRADRFGGMRKAFLCLAQAAGYVGLPEVVWVRAGVRRAFSGDRFWHC
jgi:hypothetical protein